MHLHKTLLTLIALVLVCGPASRLFAEETEQADEESGKVYRKFHPDGVVEFSDKPLRGGDELKMQELPTYRFAKPSAKPAPKPAAPNQPQLRTKKLSPSPYTRLVITSPQRDETLRANDGNISLSYTLEPPLLTHSGHRLIYLLDGHPVPNLNNLDRGTHSLVLQVMDKDNRVLIHSDSITFHVKRYFKPRS